MILPVGIPKPSYLQSRLIRREQPDEAMLAMLAHLAELYQLGKILTCYRARRSDSLNFVVTTQQGKYIVRQHHLLEETVAHEHQVLSYLQQRHFPAPHMCTNKHGRAWVTIDNITYGVYEFIQGSCPADYWWPPSSRRNLFRHAGRTLAEYHATVADLVPSHYKWDAYRPPTGESRPAGSTRWRGADFYRQPLAEIRATLQSPSATSPMDDFARSHLDAIERQLDLESVVEGRSDLTKLVIHGDYAPWNLLILPQRSLFVLDFNAARLDLKIYDIMFATFWFAWRHDHLDPDRAMAFQTGYLEAGHLNEAEIMLASDVFCWLMGRSLAERLRTHYLERRFVIHDPAKLQRFYDMCIWAAQHPQSLTRGLQGQCRTPK
jgi:Ser/Thr protein kinase RdoA (MazF antagonist)